MKKQIFTFLILLFTLNVFAQYQHPFPYYDGTNDVKRLIQTQIFVKNGNNWDTTFREDYMYSSDFSKLEELRNNNGFSYIYEYDANDHIIKVVERHFNGTTYIPNYKWENKYSNCDVPDTAFAHRNQNNSYMLEYAYSYLNNADCVPDSVYYQYPPQLNIGRREELRYDANNQLVAKYQYGLNLYGVWDTLSMKLYTYNNSGQMTTDIARGASIFSYKIENSYNADGLLDTLFFYEDSNLPADPTVYEPPVWLLRRYFVHQYNAADQLVLKSRYDLVANVPTYSKKVEYVYDIDGDMTYSYVFSYSNNTQVFDTTNYTRLIYAFTANTEEIARLQLTCNFQNPYAKGSAIQCLNLEIGKSYQMAVYDMLGRIVEQRTIEGGQDFSLNAPKLNTGLHVLTITENGQLLFSEKLMIE